MEQKEVRIPEWAETIIIIIKEKEKPKAYLKKTNESRNTG